jgi:mTERF domain-containing protein
LSPEKALKLSKRLKFKDPNGPNAVIQLFRNYGFSDSQLSTLVKKHPTVLLSTPEKTLLPKLKFLQSIGVSTTDLPKILIGNIPLLTTSLEKNLKPRYLIIRSLVRDDKEVVSVLKHWSWTFYNNSMVNDFVPNIEVLRKLGVPQRFISLLVCNFPKVAFTKHSRFVEAVNFVKEMGFDPLKSNFVLALQGIVKMDKETWESKLKIFERWGWSKDIYVLAFQRYPQYILISEKKITKTMNFLVKDMGLTPEDIARRPGILNRNLEKTIMPRCAVVNILKSRGLIKSDLLIGTFIIVTEKKFLERYVTRYQKDLPLLLDAYKGQNSD